MGEESVPATVAAQRVIVTAVGIQELSFSGSTCGQSFHEQKRGVSTCPHLTFTCICLFVWASLCQTQTPPYSPHLRFASLRIYYTLSPSEHPGRRKIAMSTKLTCFHEQCSEWGGTNTWQNFPESEDGTWSKREIFYYRHLWLNWCWLMNHGTYRWFSHEEGHEFTRLKSEILLDLNFNKSGSDIRTPV